jgi:hypothetical protein
MTVEDLVREARMHQAALLDHRAQAKTHQEARDRLIHELRDSDPAVWSYGAIAHAVGIDRELVKYILKRPRPE